MNNILFENGRLMPDDLLHDLYVSDGMFRAILPAGSRPPDATHPEQTIDLAGARVYPGFRDAHCHLLSTAETELALDASGIRSIDQLIAAGKDAISERGLYAKRLNDTLLSEQTMPSRLDLDRISDTLPVIAVRVCGHLASVNSVVLDSIPALKQRYPDGIIAENDLDMLPSLRSMYGSDDMKQAISHVIRRMLSHGLTAISSNDFGRLATADDELAVQAVLAEYPGFTYRSQYSVPLPFDPNTLLQLAAKSGAKPAVKLFRDGSLGGRTAWLRAPYSDAPDTVGQDTLDDETHEAVLTIANRLSLQVMTHAIGDQAISRTLDLLKKTSNAENPLRHAIVHAQITDDALLARMKEQHVLAIVQPLFAESDSSMAPARLGDRYADAYRFKTMADADIRLAFSSDAPVESFNPLHTIRRAMQGRQDEPASRFSFAEALHFHTGGAAYADFAEEQSGAIKAGFAADFSVFGDNLASILPDELPDRLPLMTVAGGNVYSFT